MLPGYEPKFPNEDVLTGKGLLVSLCNLVHQINSYDNAILHDLGKLYNAIMYYVALEDVCVGDDEAAYDLSREGKFFESYSFFEKCKHSKVDIPDELLGDIRSREDFLAEMKRVNEYIDNRPAEEIPVSEFATTPYDDYESLRDTLIDIIPNFNMRLKADPRSGKMDFSTDVNQYLI